MASHKEPSNIQKSLIPPPKKPKPPNIASPHPMTPKTQSSTLSYTDGADQTTPTNLGKRSRGKDISYTADAVQRKPSPPHLKTPTRKLSSNQATPRPQLDSLALFPPAAHDTDQVMCDPFLPLSGNPTQTSEVDWTDEEQYYTRLNKIQNLLKTLHEELEKARNEDSLASIIEDEETEEYLIKLTSILPSFTTNSHISPVMKGISELQSMMDQIKKQIQHSTSNMASAPPQTDKSLQGSLHAAPNSTPNPATLSSHASYKQAITNYHHQTGPNANNGHKTQPPNTQITKISSNPNPSHHPSRLIAQFIPKGIPDNMRPDPSNIVANINTALSFNPASSHLKVVAASFNTQGNLIISTRADQRASDLLKFQEAILPVLNNLGDFNEVQLREDKKWFKIQIDAVSTSSISITNHHILRSADAVHEELLACNPQYAQLQDSLAAKPRWLRAEEELTTTPRSSLVFATTDEEAARRILKQKFLAAFGRHCSVRAFQDRPPVTQCRNCWRLDHTTQQCKSDPRCRICSGAHQEENHQHTNPSSCHRCSHAQEMGDSMDTTAEGHCPHDIRCINCLGNSNVEQNHPADARRCPARLEKYGTARENERRAQKTNHPWTKVKPKKSKPKTNQVSPPTTSQANASSSNRFSILETPAATAPIQLSDANALINFDP